jgi:uncharacterized membrane protein (DUF106 family)
VALVGLPQTLVKRHALVHITASAAVTGETLQTLRGFTVDRVRVAAVQVLAAQRFQGKATQAAKAGRIRLLEAVAVLVLLVEMARHL